MITEEQAATARGQLFNFVDGLRNLVPDVIYKPYGDEGELLIIEEMKDDLLSAAKDFAEDFSIDSVKDRIYGTASELLQSHGLYGAQLSAKLNLHESRAKRFFRKRGKKTLVQWIDAANTLLDSIIGATGIDGAIKELKHLLRNSVDD
jgi:hypothetical protein